MREMRLSLDEQERHLLELALQRWRWSIAEGPGHKPVFYEAGQQQACRYTTARIDEMLARMQRLSRGAAQSEPTTDTNASTQP